MQASKATRQGNINRPNSLGMVPTNRFITAAITWRETSQQTVGTADGNEDGNQGQRQQDSVKARDAEECLTRIGCKALPDPQA